MPADQEVTRKHVRLVFLATPAGGGGGGGGRRQPASIARAQMPGPDASTLRVASVVVARTEPPAVAALVPVVLDAKPLASGFMFQTGLPNGSVAMPLAYGLGSGEGIGGGEGSGIGSGRGPALGPGSDGGTGGGASRGGSGATLPTLLFEVKPRYNSKALRDKIQGAVWLEVVVKEDGVPGNIRVIRSLDPHGLDQEAILALQQWRFSPGRLRGVPVPVLVVVELTFRIR